MKMEDIAIVGLLRMAWVAGILPILIASLPFSYFTSLHHSLLVFAGRGKTFRSSSSLLTKLTVPQKFFSHFYVLAMAWTSLLLLTIWVYAHQLESLVYESTSHSSVASHLIGGSHIFSHETYATSMDRNCRVWRSVFLLLLMEIQVLWRLYESLYVFNYSSAARMHVFGYLTGIFFYTAAPLSLCCNCAPEAFALVKNRATEFIVKGKNNMPPVEIQWLEYLSPLVKLGWYQWVGAVIFFWGWLHQRRCHALLGSLRKVKGRVDDYQIPHGDWFEIASSAHYLAEIVIYAGLLTASGGLDLNVWLLFAFVVANLGFAAAETHRWYHHKFENYPHSRYAIIPLIY